jgi:hypothetical protein
MTPSELHEMVDRLVIEADESVVISVAAHGEDGTWSVLGGSALIGSAEMASSSWLEWREPSPGTVVMDASCKKLAALVRGTDQQRALRQTANAAVKRAAEPKVFKPWRPTAKAVRTSSRACGRGGPSYGFNLSVEMIALPRFHGVKFLARLVNPGQNCYQEERVNDSCEITYSNQRN